MKVISPLAFLLLYFNLLGQSIPEWEKFYGGTKLDEINDVIQNRKGEIVLVGHTKSKSFRGSDILVRVIDINGKVKVKQNFGGKRTDIGNAVIHTFDGGYIIVGHTNSKWENPLGGVDAWIVKIDNSGVPLWHHSFGGEKDDQFNDVVELQDGSLVAAGHKDKQPYVVRISKDGENVFFQKTIPFPSASINALVLSKTGELALTGTIGTGNKSQVLFLQMDDSGNIIKKFEKLNEFQLSTGEDILQDVQSGHFIITGKYYSVRNRGNIGLLRINKDGEIIWTGNYDGSEIDTAPSLIQASNGELVLAGRTYSHLRGARRSRGWIKIIDTDGELITSRNDYFGGSQNDYFNKIIELQEGGFLLSGASASNPGLDKDAWVIKIKGPSLPFNPSNVSISEISWNEEILNNRLDAEERGYISFYLSNNSATPITGLKGETSLEKPVEGLEIFEKINFGFIAPFEKKKFSLPILGDLDLISDSTKIIVTFTDVKNKPVAHLDFKLNTKAKPLPFLQFSEATFDTNNDLPDRNEKIKFKVKVTNIGNATAETTGIRFYLPLRTKAISKQYFPLGDIAPGENETITFEFKAKSFYEYDTISIEVVAFEKTARRGTKATFGLKIRNFYNIEDDPSFIIKPQNNFLQGNGGGPSMMYPDWVDISDIYWKAPDQDEDGLYHEESVNNIQIKLRVKSDTKLSSEDFKLFLNNAEAKEGVDFDEGATAIAENQSFREQSYSYTYTTKVYLKEGENNIVLKARAPGGWETSAPMTIYYNLPRHNLHVYSFGIPHDDLKFTTKDADDFANKFKGQDNKLFDQVNISTFTRPEETTENAIVRAIEDIRNDCLINEKILEGDAIILFMSSHGFVLPNRPAQFRIAASNFELMRERSTSIEFEGDVLQLLNEIPKIHKVIFVDACYSGAIANIDEGAKSNDDLPDPVLSKAIVDLAAASTGYKTIVSCSAGELSYEDPKWGNSSFTKALLEAFSNKEVKGIEGETQRADKNKDGVIYTDELYEFLCARVPAIVKTKKPKTQKLQHPYMPEEQLEESLPFFIIQ